MANYTTSPNMNLTIPVVSVDPGPDWASNLNLSLSAIDLHDHSSGKGVQVTPSGLNINSDLTFNANNLTSARSLRLFTNVAALGLATDLGCLYRFGADLYYNDGSGNQIRITQSGSVSGSSGTITGLPSGTASAAYSSVPGTFVFQQATSTAANMDAATLIIRYPGSYPSPSGNYVALQASSSLATGFALTFPATLPATSGAFLTSSSAGVLSYTNVDNSTLAISAGVIAIPSGGVTATQIANATITATQIANTTITKTKFAALGQQISSASGSSNISTNTPTDITNATVTITTSGRPVMVFLQAAQTSSSGQSYVGGFGSTSTSNFTAKFMILRGASIIAVHTVGGIGSVSVPPHAVSFMDTGASAGSNTYKAQYFADTVGNPGSSANYGNVQMVAYEL